VIAELFLPLEQAVIAAAYQNLLYDEGNDPDPNVGDLWNVYIEEARHLLETSGENYLGQNGHPTIKVLPNP
jgi:hypothetical protein